MHMKQKVFLIVMVLVLGSAILQAQDSYRRFSFAVSLQPHVNWIHADESSLSNGPVRLGIEEGLRLDYKFERFFALSAGLNLNTVHSMKQ